MSFIGGLKIEDAVSKPIRLLVLWLWESPKLLNSLTP